MSDKKSEFQYEAAHLANEQLGDALDSDGKRILGTERGKKALGVYEIAAEGRTDPMTGLLVRRIWEDEMAAHYRTAERYQQPFSIVMMDVDDFKRVNDTRGHAAGDLVMQKFGRAILSRFRKADISGRYGGDEAIVMLTVGLNAKDIDSEESLMAKDLSRTTGVGVSVGIANWDGHSSLQETIKAADQKLYRNKGKNNNV
jgi:diguanylate cyclase (GGDEF)-like protein